MPYTDHFDRNNSNYWTNPYNTMKKHLDDYLESLKEVKSIEDEKDCLFKNEYIKELTGRYSVLHNNMNWVTKLNSYIDTAIEKNCMLHERISLIRSNIENILICKYN